MTAHDNLCRAIYRANHVAGSVVIVAYGKHPTEGYKAWFQDTPIAVFPPEYLLQHRSPTEAAVQVETEFVVWKSFPATELVQSVTVHDADGRQQVEVEQSPDAAMVCED